MPWKEVDPMDQRFRFVYEAFHGERSMSDLCLGYGISRKTGYKWLNRYVVEGVEGLGEKSRAPHRRPRKTPKEIEELLVKEKNLHPHWGPKKLVVILRRKYGLIPPAVSTAGEILKRNGLVKPQKRRQNAYIGWPGKFTHPERSNQVWGADYKGWFRTGDGRKCFPLTISDLFSRYLLCLDAHPGHTHELTMASFERVFQEYGLPEVLRVDNGSPFAGGGLGNFSRLNTAWLRLGIQVEFIDPGHPEQNGRHERMHKTLKAETTRPPAHNHAEQQKRFDAWRMEFNEERPHEALKQTTPGTVYQKSKRAYPDQLPDFVYPDWYERRRVRKNGEIRWESGKVFVSTGLAGTELGLDTSHPQGPAVYAGNILLGIIEKTNEGGKSPSQVLVRIG